LVTWGKYPGLFKKVCVHLSRKELIVEVDPLLLLLGEEGGPARVAPGASALSGDESFM
jgi:hypothetical protein